ncbi:MAG: MATE family efflux transporter [Muribaculaceae bacterium]|nr:MATE family efflux transporter [Muribaculaceae bacterium]
MKLNSLNRSILALTIPSIVANITTPLLGLVDTAIVGHMGSAVFIAAIALGGSVFNLLYWCFGFLRAGTSGITAQAVGAGDTHSSSLSLFRGLFVAAALGVLMIATAPIVARFTLNFMGADPEEFRYAYQYVEVCIWGAPAVMGVNTLSGWFLGMQNTKAPMYMSILINVVNIALSTTLVYGMKWGVEGLATGTMLAQWVGLLVGLLLCRRYKVKLTKWRDMMEWGSIRRFFTVNSDIFLRTLCMIAVTLWFTRSGSVQGTEILAANAVLMQLFMLMSYFMDGFAFAGEAVIGKAIGAQKHREVSDYIHSLLRWGVVVASFFTIVYAVSGDIIISLLSSQPDVTATAHEYYWWAVTIPFAGFATFTWDGIFIGATMTRKMLIAIAIAMLVFFGLLFWLMPIMGNHGLWLAFVAYLLSRGVASHILGRRLIRAK